MVTSQSIHAELRPRYVPTICIFPPELLAHIFAYLALGPLEQASRQTFVVSQVSQRWREVALLFPALWTRPDFSSAWRAELMLARSGNMPLDLDICLYPGPLMDLAKTRVVELALKQWPRIRSLMLECNADLFSNYFAGSFFIGNSILESLHVTLSTNPTGRKYFFFSTSLGSVLPALRSLRLINCAITWHMVSLPNLTELHVSPSGSDYHTVYSLLGALARMQSLKVLSINGFITPSWTEPREPGRAINLPSLAKLSVYDLPVTICVIMQNLLFPSTTQVKLHCSKIDEFFDEDDCTNLRLALQAYSATRQIADGSSVPLRWLTLRYDDPESSDLLMRLSFASSRDEQPLLDFRVIASEHLGDICGDDEVPEFLQHVECITIDGCVIASLESTAEPLGGLEHLTRVHTLVLQGRGFTSVLSLLAENPEDAVDDLEHRFPALENLVVRGVSLGSTCTFYDHDDALWASMESGPLHVDILSRVLRESAALGKPLRTLRFEACNGFDDLGDEFASQLAQTVGVVEGWGENVLFGIDEGKGPGFHASCVL